MTLFKKLTLAVCTLLISIPPSLADDMEQLLKMHAGNQSTQTASKSNSNKISREEADELISSAMDLLGVAYRFGGTSPTNGMDCSGFMQYIFRKSLNINLPRTSAEQAKMGVAVERSALQAGDLVFFNTSGNRISHVGLYIGNNRFIHAPRSGKNIEITSMSNAYWSKRYITARRVKARSSSRFTE